MADDLDAAIARQRERLTKTRNDVQAKIAELQLQLGEIDRQFAAVLAYEQTLAGKLPVLALSKRKPSAKRAGRGQKQTQVLFDHMQHLRLLLATSRSLGRRLSLRQSRDR